ncbi:extracellular solute-binding protein [Marinicrinis lubricantis]|uniref:Extracellular solute-binding protein n=1 Tax=Marinicrinis lubricantis TaxID=2086470 RepID=A0ABW1IJN5_9BACL
MQEKPSRTTFRERLDDMIHSLRDEIVTGKLKSGAFIPSLNQLSKRFKLSINSVQKGLEQLVSESLIERIPRVGIRVKDSAVPATVTISVGVYPSLINDIDLNQLIFHFQKSHPHIHIKTVPLPYLNYDEIVHYYIENEIVDVMAINHFNYNQLRSRHPDLSDLFEPLELESGVYPYLLPPFMEKQNQMFVHPITFSPVILCFNKQHFAECQAPVPAYNWKWTDFMACLEKLESQEKNRLSFYFYPSTTNRWPIFMLQSGIDFAAGDSNKGLWASERIMDSIQTCYDIIHRQNLFSLLLSENDFNVEKRFAEQQVSVMITSYFNLNKLRDAGPPFDIAPLPHVHVPKTLLLTIGLALIRRSKQKEAARAFMEYIASYEAQLHIRKHTYSIPALQQAAEWEGDEIGYRPAGFGIYREISDTFATLSDLNLSPERMEQLLSTMNLYWMGIQSKEALITQLSKL